jgi:hypothetical protein
MLVNELFEQKDLGQEAKELVAMVDNPGAITKVKQWLQSILQSVTPKPQQEPTQSQEPQQQEPEVDMTQTEEPVVTESVATDKAIITTAIDKIVQSGDVTKLNAVISFLKGAELMEEAEKVVIKNIKQGDKGGLANKLSTMVQNHNAPFEQKIALFDKMQTEKNFWDGSDLLNEPVGNIYKKLQGDPIMAALAQPIALQFRGAMGYGPDQGPGEFLLALTGRHVDLAEKSDLVIVDGVGVEVKADGKSKAKSGKWGRSGGRLYSTSGYGTGSTARIGMFKAMVDNGVPGEVMKQYGWPVREKNVKYPVGGLNFNIKGVANLNQLFTEYMDRAGVQEVMKAMISGLYIELPQGMENDFINAVGQDGTIDYKTMMIELIALAHEYYKHQEGHEYIMIFNTFTGGYVMMGSADSVRDHFKNDRLRTNSGMDFFDDRSKGSPQLLTGPEI